MLRHDFWLRLISMHLLHFHESSEKLQCPYKGCEKHFDRPTMITDNSVVPRQTHFACPFCMSRLELYTAKEKIVGVRATEYPMVFDSPAKCAHFSGLLNAPPGSMITRDECLICPKVLQCNVRKKWSIFLSNFPLLLLYPVVFCLYLLSLTNNLNQSWKCRALLDR